MARGVVGMDFGVNEETNRQRRELLDSLHHRPGIGRIMAAVHQHHSFRRQDDSGIGISFPRGLHVNPLFDLPELRSQVLRYKRRSTYR